MAVVHDDSKKVGDFPSSIYIHLQVAALYIVRKNLHTFDIIKHLSILFLLVLLE